jgi:hypothetical protein
MKIIYWIFAVALCLAVNPAAIAQEHQEHRSNRQIVEFVLTFQEREVVSAAEAMPAEKYEFTPSQGEFKGVRSFGAQVRHIAADNYMLGSAILGEKVPVDVGTGESGSMKVRSKAELLAYLKESFAYMHRAAAAIDDSNTPVTTPWLSPWPEGTATRLGLAIEDLVHTYDHYGQMVEYLRMNGIVPPASRKTKV